MIGKHSCLLSGRDSKARGLEFLILLTVTTVNSIQTVFSFSESSFFHTKRSSFYFILFYFIFVELYLIPLCVDFGGVEIVLFCIDIFIVLTIYVFQQPKEYLKSTQTQTQMDSSKQGSEICTPGLLRLQKILFQNHDASKSRGPKFGPLLQRVRRIQI